MRNSTIIGTLILTTTILGACDKKAPQPPLSGPTPVAPQPGPSAQPSAQDLPPGHPPVAPSGGMATPAPTGDLGPQVAGAGITVTLPDSWKRQQPASAMRLAEAVAPAAEGEAPALAVFSIAGGSVEENITRWSGQVRGSDGVPVPPKTETKTIDGMTVTVVEMSGTVSGMGIDGANPNWTMRGAIVQAPQGMLFIKMYGPSKTMSDQADAFNSMISSIKKS